MKRIMFEAEYTDVTRFLMELGLVVRLKAAITGLATWPVVIQVADEDFDSVRELAEEAGLTTRPYNGNSFQFK